MTINKLVWTQLSLDDALNPYFDDPSVYLTDDPETIARRQRELTCLMENQKLAEAFEQLAVRFDELEALRTLPDTGDPMRALRSVGGLEAFRKNLLETKNAISENVLFVADAALIDKLLENFPEDYSQLWACYEGVNLPGSLTYRIEVDPMLNIERYRLVAVQTTRYRRPLRLPMTPPGSYGLSEKMILVKSSGVNGTVEQKNTKANRAMRNQYLEEESIDVIQKCQLKLLPVS